MGLIMEEVENGWVGFPEELKKKYIEFYREYDSVLLQDILNMLKKHIDMRTSLKINVVRWINRFFADCLLPLELHEEEWIRSFGEFISLLDTEETYISELTKENNVIVARNDPRCLESLEVLRQNMEVFYAIAYWYGESKNQFKKKMNTILAYTKLNVSYLLQQKGVKELFSSEYQKYDFYIHGLRYWEEPLAYITEEAFGVGFFRALTPYMEEYKKFLEGYSADNPEVLEKLMGYAETSLGKMNLELMWD